MTAGDQPHETPATDPAGEHAPRPGAGDVDASAAEQAATEPAVTEPGPDARSEADDVAGLGGDDELTLAQMALAERTADLQRLQAEFVNYKRRVERDRELVKQNATFGALTSLLPVLDDIDRAREHGEVEGGFKAVADSLDRAVASQGLTRFGATGEEFDPTLHEALMHGHSAEVTTTTVDQVVQTGYRIGERVVRAARVTVLDPEA